MDPPKRERKRQVNYAENEYFRNALKAPGRAPGGPRLPKMPALQDFQFFNIPRLTEIYDQEQAYELFKHSQGQKEAAARSQVGIRQVTVSSRARLPALAILFCMHSGPSAMLLQATCLACLQGQEWISMEVCMQQFRACAPQLEASTCICISMHVGNTC